MVSYVMKGVFRVACPLSFSAIKRLDEIRINFVLSFDAPVYNCSATTLFRANEPSLTY